MKLNVFGAGRPGRELIATAGHLHAGRTTHVVEVRVHDGDRLVANLLVTQFVIAPRDYAPEPAPPVSSLAAWPKSSTTRSRSSSCCSSSRRSRSSTPTTTRTWSATSRATRARACDGARQRGDQRRLEVRRPRRLRRPLRADAAAALTRRLVGLGPALLRRRLLLLLVPPRLAREPRSSGRATSSTTPPSTTTSRPRCARPGCR